MSLLYQKQNSQRDYIDGNQDTSFFFYGDRCFRNKQISNLYLSSSLRKKTNTYFVHDRDDHILHV